MEAAGMAAVKAFRKLAGGNRRFSTGKPRGPNRSVKRRNAVAGAQRPYAIIVGCSDSRIPPEIVFDAGIGDLFVIRTAGGIVDDIALGSIEYAATHLGTRLVVVLGHSHCGAVETAMKPGEAPAHMASIVKTIRPCLPDVADWLECVNASIDATVNALRNGGPLLEKLLRTDTLKVIGACYDLHTGVVDFRVRPCDWKRQRS